MVKLEVCVDSIQGLNAAMEGGADRIELCSALELGGLSPNEDLLKAARKIDVPAMVMVRPRSGDFNWDAAELRQCVREINYARDAGFDGVVIGAATETGRLDQPAITTMMIAAADLDMTLHRVVDETPDPVQAAIEAQKLGLKRILSSGGAETAMKGLGVIRQMIKAAPDLSVMPGAGVVPENVDFIVKRTKTREIHGSFSLNGVTSASNIKAAKAAISAL